MQNSLSESDVGVKHVLKQYRTIWIEKLLAAVFVSDGQSNIDETRTIQLPRFNLKRLFFVLPPPTSCSSFLALYTLFARPAGSAGLV
jgi:hypothetical protein